MGNGETGKRRGTLCIEKSYLDRVVALAQELNVGGLGEE